MKTLGSLIVGACLVATAFTSHGNVTALGSSINLSADANAGANPAQNQHAVSQTTTLNSLSNSITVQAVNGNLAATVVSAGTANWTSASAGAFTLTDIFSTSNLSAYGSSRVAVDGSSWVYSFVSSVPATLTLNYSLAYSGSYSYSEGLYLNQFTGPTVQGGSFVRQVTIAEAPSAKPPLSGTVQFSLNAGTDYTFQLFDDANLNQLLPALSTEMDRAFSFQITSVPEPSVVTLVGMAGLTALIFLRSKIFGGSFNSRR